MALNEVKAEQNDGGSLSISKMFCIPMTLLYFHGVTFIMVGVSTFI